MDKNLFAQKVKNIDKAYREILGHLFEEYGLTRSQAIVLHYIYENLESGITQKDIENHFKVTKSTVSGIVDRLQKGGFIKRVKDKNDSRINHLLITEKAKELDNEVQKVKCDLDDKSTSCLTEDEYETLLNLLDKVYANLEEIKEDKKDA